MEMKREEMVEMGIAINELAAFKYAITGRAPIDEMNAALYVVQHYHFENNLELGKKLEATMPHLGPVPEQIVEALRKGFEEGQKYTQIDAMK